METTLLPKCVTHSIDKCQWQFLQGNSPEQKKIHKVKWEKVCRERNKGGLGIRKMRPFNKAMIAKQTWLIVKNDESLSMRILACNYSKGLKGVEACKFSRDSVLWKGTCKQTDVIELGMGKNVFNGCITSFWFDRQLSDVVLWNIRIAEVNPGLVRSTVADM